MLDKAHEVRSVVLLLCAWQHHDVAHNVHLNHQELLRALRPGSTIGAAVKTALAVITKAEQKQNVELSPYVSKSFGFGIGVQSQESWLALTANNSTPIKYGCGPLPS